MRSKLIFAVSILLVFGYLFTYVLVRRANTGIIEIDGCPTEGCTRVYFNYGTFSSLYTPLIALDERLTHCEFEFTGWKK